MQTEKNPKVIIRRKRNSDIEAGYEKSSSQIEVAQLAKFERNRPGNSRTDKIAGDFECQHKWMFKEAMKYFPDEPWMRTVSHYYPKSIHGPLLIDECAVDYELARLERKRIVLESIGYKYLIIKSGMTDAECFMEIEACGQRLKMQSPI